MKKILTMMFVFVLLFSIGTIAQDLELIGGLTFNTFDGTIQLGGGYEAEVRDDLKNGPGFYAGGRYWLSNKLAIGAGYDQAGSEDEISALSIAGPYAELVFRANKHIKLKGGLAFYTMEAEYLGVKIGEGTGTGLLFGGYISGPLLENVSLSAGLDYRVLTIEDDYKDIWNFSGLKFNGGITLAF